MEDILAVYLFIYLFGSCLKGKNIETSPDLAALLDKPQRNENIHPHINIYRNILSSFTQRAKKWKQHRCP